MRKLYLLLLAAGLVVPAYAQEKFELGKPNNDNCRYLDEYEALKEYINYSTILQGMQKDKSMTLIYRSMS
ncbi:MAG: hypothetical protein J6Z14_06250 [Prevotella sp.]|nr:hypothetical protein [Prevotella sp.]